MERVCLLLYSTLYALRRKDDQCTDIKSIFLTVSDVTNYEKGESEVKQKEKKNDRVKRNPSS